MILLMLVFLIMIALLSIVSYVSIKRCLDIDEKLDELSFQVEESLDIIDDCYGRIAKTSETSLATDDPTIQQLIADIKHTKHALLLIANKIVAFEKDDKE